jgi:radical SAM protein with 4Fe4S-binding SPASM domain
VGRGEPTIHPQFDQIVKTIKRRGFHLGIATNASLLTPDRCEHLVDYDLDRIVASIDAGSRDTYPRIHTITNVDSFDRIIRNLQVLNQIKGSKGKKIPQVMLSFVISRLNYYEAFKMIDLGKEVGADQIVFKYIIPYENIKFLELTENEKCYFSSQLPAFMKHAESYGIDLKIEPPIGNTTANPKFYHKKTETVYSRIPCYIGWYFALITAEGSVIPCCQCMEKMGDLREQGFRDIWYSKRYSDFRMRMKRFPEHYDRPTNCACDECAFDKINATIYNALHFYNPIHLYEAQREFSVFQLLPAIFKSKTTKGAKAVKRKSGS